MGSMRFARHFFLWRVPDYLMIIVIAIVAAVIGAKVHPHCRDFEWTDSSISHPFTTKEAFPMYSVVIAVIFIALVYFVGELCVRWNRPAGKLNMCLHINGWIVTHAYSIILAFVFVNVSKLYAGRLRPDFIARLAREGITEANFSTFTRKQICHAARGGRLSFPSGHSGTSFAGYVPPCLYLMGLMQTLNGGRVWLATIALLPLVLPVAVAVSRTVDYRHNFDDVLCGSICGAMCGIFAVLINFRVSVRGEWTLRDHPDDKMEMRARPQTILTDDNERLRPMEVHSGKSSSGSNSYSDSDSEAIEVEREREAEVMVMVGSAQHTSANNKSLHQGEAKHLPSSPATKVPTGSDLQLSPPPAASLHDGYCISPAVHQGCVVSPSPSICHSCTFSSAQAKDQSNNGVVDDKTHWAETKELQDVGSPTNLTPSGRRKSYGDPAIVERFLSRE